MRGRRRYHEIGRRDLVVGGSLALAACRASQSPPSARAPEPSWGVMSGDVTSSQAVVWSRSDRPATMVVEWATDPDFKAVRRILGPRVSTDTDLVGKTLLTGLVPDTRIHYRARFEGEQPSEWLVGSFPTPPLETARDVLFSWSGDTNGQGWGIDESRGGMPAFAALGERRPEILHLRRRRDLWRQSDPPREGRGRRRAVEELHDAREAACRRDPILAREADAGTPRREPRIDVLAGPARRAFIEYVPTLLSPAPPGLMYRSVRWGPLLEIFFVDGRSFRTLNYPPPPAQAFLGAAQLAWLEGALAASTATWKIVACDMPLSLIVSEPASDGGESFDAFANRDNGAPFGSPADGQQFFGMVAINGKTRSLEVTLVDARGRDLFTKELAAAT